MAIIKDIVIDTDARPAPLARFWAATLDGYQVAAYDDAEIERLRAMGVEDTEDDPSVLVEPKDGRGPRLFVQRVPEPRRVKNRVHLDLACDDLESEVRRLLALGARVLDRRPDWVVLADPGGNEFCLAPSGERIS